MAYTLLHYRVASDWHQAADLHRTPDGVHGVTCRTRSPGAGRVKGRVRLSAPRACRRCPAAGAGGDRRRVARTARPRRDARPHRRHPRQRRGPPRAICTPPCPASDGTARSSPRRRSRPARWPSSPTGPAPRSCERPVSHVARCWSSSDPRAVLGVGGLGDRTATRPPGCRSSASPVRPARPRPRTWSSRRLRAAGHTTCMIGTVETRIGERGRRQRPHHPRGDRPARPVRGRRWSGGSPRR